MTHTPKTIAIINGTGRQAASVIRAVSAVGWAVRAQIYSPHPLIAQELAELENVTLYEESLGDNPALIDRLFRGADYAFINTFPAGDEVTLGKDLVDAAKRNHVQHFIYSSMPDHSVWNPEWPALPNWACKFTVENYIRQVDIPATFIYAGVYYNNFTSLSYPLFGLDFKPDGTVEWRAPFHPDTKLPWLDAEQDVGPTVLQLLKEGPRHWKGCRLALTFEFLTPRQVCDTFQRTLDRPCRYIRDKHVEVRVPIPTSYREQLAGIEILFGQYDAPYFPGPDFDVRESPPPRSRDGDRPSWESAPDDTKSKPRRLTSEARRLWPGFRRLEDYVRETFPIEEEANGKTWMKDKSVST